MADSMIGQGMDLSSRGKAYNTQTDYDAYVNRWEEKDKLDKLYDDKTTLSFTDMLGLMVAQFQNQTMDNQASTTDMMNQLVQMSSMQAMTEMTTNIKELTLANVMAYSASLVGQTVTLGVYNEKTEKLEEIVGVVEGAGTYNGEQVIFVDGKSYLLSSIMAVGKLPPRVEEDEKPDEGEDGEGEGEGGTPPVDNEGSTGGTDGAGGTTGDDKVDQTPDAGDAGNNGGSQEPDEENDNSVG